MAELKSICVYCGSNPGTDPDFASTAKALGVAMAKAGIRLVYGGGSVGLMGIVARSVLAADGGVTGIIPQFLKEKELMLKEVDELIVTADMHERKRIMFERADAFVALPGGLGTLEEVVEIATWAQLERHAKPVLMVNIGGFWDPLIALFRRMTDDGFLHKPFLGHADHKVDLPVIIVKTVGEIIPALQARVARTPRPVLENVGRADLL
jgi:uncharacterized protein (TIGR00730 family)